MKSKIEYDKIINKIKILENKKQDLVITNMPKFERGIVEAALQREFKVWDDLAEVFKKHSINPSVNTAIVSNNQPSNDAHRPNLACAGVKVNISFIVSPMDSSGKDGSLPDDVIDTIVKITKEIEDLNRNLEEI